MSFVLGRTVGGYEFLDIVRSSKTQISYRVRNALTGRVEMLRILQEGLQHDQLRVERFLREMKVHAHLSHANIVAFHNAMEIEGRFVIVTELVEGVTLAERLTMGPLPLRKAFSYMYQALEALGYAHAQGVVHRDLTTDRMIVTPDGTLKLCDFGLAKSLTSPELTQVGTVVGTLGYISPEQVKGSPTLDARTDLYSLGVVFYEMVTGRLPFEAKSQFEIMLAHVRETPKPPSEVNPAVPEELDEIILKAMAKDPADRFQNADEFHTALSDVDPALGRVSPRVQPLAAHDVMEPPVAPIQARPLVSGPIALPASPQPAANMSTPLFRAMVSSRSDISELTIIGIVTAVVGVVAVFAYVLMSKL